MPEHILNVDEEMLGVFEQLKDENTALKLEVGQLKSQLTNWSRDLDEFLAPLKRQKW